MKVGARGARGGCDPAVTLELPVSIESAQHYVWGSVCDGWRLLDHGGLSVIQERMPPGAGEPWHVHKRSRQFFYVLSGCIAIDRGDGPTGLRAGEGLHVPPRVPHQVSNESRGEAVFLVISSPFTAVDRTEVERPPQSPPQVERTTTAR